MGEFSTLQEDGAGGGGGSGNGSVGAYDYPASDGGECIDCGDPNGVPPPPCYKRQMGKMYICIEDRRGRPLCLCGACWPMMLLTFSIVLGASLFVFIFVAHSGKVPASLLAVGVVISAWTLLCLAMTGCSNPGIFPRYEEPPVGEEGWSFNSNTESYRPRGVVYCSESQVLVQDIDHFCPWTGNTIARGNMRNFQCFTGSICVLLAYLGFLFMYSMSQMKPSGY